MFPAEVRKSTISLIRNWMKGIHGRVGDGVSWGLTAQHRNFIEMLEKDEVLTFDDWKEEVTQLMQLHAMARNDIYDTAQLRVRFDAEGNFTGKDSAWQLVSKQEGEFRYFLNLHRENYQHDPTTCKYCSGHMPQLCKERKR